MQQTHCRSLVLTLQITVALQIITLTLYTVFLSNTFFEECGLSSQFGAAFGQQAAMMSEDALAEREHARQGHGVDGEDAAVSVGGRGSSKKVKPSVRGSKVHPEDKDNESPPTTTFLSHVRVSLYDSWQPQATP